MISLHFYDFLSATSRFQFLSHWVLKLLISVGPVIKPSYSPVLFVCPSPAIQASLPSWTVDRSRSFQLSPGFARRANTSWVPTSNNSFSWLLKEIWTHVCFPVLRIAAYVCQGLGTFGMDSIQDRTAFGAWHNITSSINMYRIISVQCTFSQRWWMIPCGI